MRFGIVIVALLLGSPILSFAKDTAQKNRRPSAAGDVTVSGKQAERLFKLAAKVDPTSSQCKMEECVATARLICSSDFEHTTYDCRIEAEQ